MQHMAVANAHTMVERTLRAHTLKRRSCEKRRGRQRVSLAVAAQTADPWRFCQGPESVFQLPPHHGGLVL